VARPPAVCMWVAYLPRGWGTSAGPANPSNLRGATLQAEPTGLRPQPVHADPQHAGLHGPVPPVHGHVFHRQCMRTPDHWDHCTIDDAPRVYAT
jgi:hypothetical protein